MIFYVARGDHLYTMQGHLNYCEQLRAQGYQFQAQLEYYPYEKLFTAAELPQDTYIFADLERLSDLELEHAAWIAAQLQAAGCRTLNHPLRTLRRYELLKTLWNHGINSFRAFRLSDDRSDLRYPVFLRTEGEHQGSLSEVLYNDAELQAALLGLSQRPAARSDYLICEYFDIEENGSYHKYGAFVVGGQVLPRHYFRDAKWVVKYPIELTAEVLQIEREYMSTNPHQRQLQKVAELAQVEYGRIDYSLWQGKLQVWEINTNPNTTVTPREGDLRRGIHVDFCQKFDAALAEVDQPQLDAHQMVPLLRPQAKLLPYTAPPPPSLLGELRSLWRGMRKELGHLMFNPNWLAVPSTP